MSYKKLSCGLYADLCGALADHLGAAKSPAREFDPEFEHLRKSVAAAELRPGYDFAATRSYANVFGMAVDSGIRRGIRPIATALAALPVELPWAYHYPCRDGEADLADRIGFAELIGPDAPLHAPRCRVGFTLVAASTNYPMHAHPAVELYLVITGRARWSGSSGQRTVPPGGFVLHQTHEPHAMETAEEPMLALYSWRGDLDTPAFYL